MGIDHLGAGMSLPQLVRMIREIATQTIQNAAIGRAGIRVYDGGWIRIEGGGLHVTGAADVSGILNGTGDLIWSGPWHMIGDGIVDGTFTQNGMWGLNGTGTINGNYEQNGDATVKGDINVESGGRIVVGPIVIDRNGAYGGRIAATTLLLDAGSVLGAGTITAQSGLNATSGGVTAVTGNIVAASGDISAPLGHIGAYSMDVGPGAKNFRIEHPSRPGYWLRHGSTESPVSGTEYTGRATVGEDGSVVVDLPDYFEALNRERNRTVQVTPVGSPFMVGADEVTDGKVTLYGEPGRDVFWLVKAERITGEFPVVEKIAEDQ